MQDTNLEIKKQSLVQMIDEDAFGEGIGNALQYSCLENPMDGGAWWAMVHSITKSQTRLKRLALTLWCL